MKIDEIPNVRWAILLCIVMLGSWTALQSMGLLQSTDYKFSVPLYQTSLHHTKIKPSQNTIIQKPVFEKQSISIATDPLLDTDEVHSGSLALLGEGRIFALWYGGSREGARDVRLFKATFDNDQWSEPAVLMTVEKLAEHTQRYIKKLGNAVAIKHTNGTLYVFFNSVTLGGWAGSAINIIQSHDDGHTFSAPQRLVTSPFHNISTLVRTAPFLYANGDIGLPVYHEFIGKYSELLRVSSDGALVFKQRISDGDRALQPSVAIHSPSFATKWQRNSNMSQGRVLLSHTVDGGQTWSRNNLTAIPNPDSGVTSLALQYHVNGKVTEHGALLVYNHSPKGRYRLSIGYADTTGQDFTWLADLEYNKNKKSRFSYPQMRKNHANGFYELVYTANRDTIEHVRFNHAWLNTLFKAQGLELLPVPFIDLPSQGVSQSSLLSMQQGISLQPVSTAHAHNFSEPALQSLPNMRLYTVPYLLVMLCVLWSLIRYYERKRSRDGQLTFIGSSKTIIGQNIRLLTAIFLTALLLFICIRNTIIVEWFRGIFGGLSSASWCILSIYIYQCIFVQYECIQKPFHYFKTQLLYCIAMVGVLFYPLALGISLFDPYQFGYAFSPYFAVFMAVLMLLAFCCFKNIFILLWLALGFILFSLFPFESLNFWDYLLDPMAVIMSLIMSVRVQIYPKRLRFRCRMHRPFNS